MRKVTLVVEQWVGTSCAASAAVQQRVRLEISRPAKNDGLAALKTLGQVVLGTTVCYANAGQSPTNRAPSTRSRTAETHSTAAGSGSPSKMS